MKQRKHHRYGLEPPHHFGGLSNERELARLCPEEFHRDNQWGDAAMKIFYVGGSTKHWKHKDESQRHSRIRIFSGLLGTFDLPHEDKTAVAGWMLSEMLTECPEHIQNKGKP